MKEFKQIISLIILGIVIILVFSASGCLGNDKEGTSYSGAGPESQKGGGFGDETGKILQEISILPTGELTEEEESDILYIAKEEKLARDCYLDYYEKWGYKVFSNIAESEQTHMKNPFFLYFFTIC
ncbi:DUF2202 domain-containing protein [Methanoplanus sp. FWC-SCC4]|uniref:DUF2202 domain-containing protein n=1 Tax=Methanochimaera problematica TaxID=2609417 RepID=A0AA97FD45_9EURY|nr:DUF2202 domain-containing protein [Methanoplanus sp. FWC-SCC4]WOF17210.1 DUF2202 domain-containing protein [Methanoplanus sp. FWC-SCC4]